MPFLHKDRPNLLHASTDALRQEAIRQTRLDRLWCRHDSPPGRVTKITLEETVNFFTVFPGGQWLVIILEDGRLCLRELCEPDRVPSSITVKLGASVREVMHNFWASRAVDGSATLALSQYAISHSSVFVPTAAFTHHLKSVSATVSCISTAYPLRKCPYLIWGISCCPSADGLHRSGTIPHPRTS